MSRLINNLLRLTLACTVVTAGAGELTRNPFLPPADFSPVAVSGAESNRSRNTEFKVTGILLSGGDALVSVGGQVVAPGEEVNGYVLLEVAEDHAVFQRGDELVTLNLYPEKDDEPNVR